MRIHFYTGGFTHTLYREQIHALPHDVEVTGSADLHATSMKSDIARSASSWYRALNGVKRAALGTIVQLGIPNIRYVSSAGCDLIHSAQYPLLNRTPWVVDFEDASVFAWYDPQNLAHRRVRWSLERLFNRPACRAILPWSHAARESLTNAVDCGPFLPKIRVVYPAIRPAARKVTRSDPTVRLLFVGTAFYFKGGVETLLAFERLHQRLPLQLTMISFVPPEIRTRFEGLRGLNVRSRVSPAELEAAYRESDVLVAPFHTDTFGFVLLEAFAHSMPCIATDQFAMPEIVTHGATGLVVRNSSSRFGPDRLPRFSLHRDGMAPLLKDLSNPPDWYVDELAGAIESLVRDEDRRRRMGEVAFQEVVSGRFSIESRRRVLEQIYGTTSDLARHEPEQHAREDLKRP